MMVDSKELLGLQNVDYDEAYSYQTRIFRDIFPNSAEKDLEDLIDEDSECICLNAELIEALWQFVRATRGDQVELYLKEDHPLVAKKTSNGTKANHGIFSIAPMIDEEKFEEEVRSE